MKILVDSEEVSSILGNFLGKKEPLSFIFGAGASRGYTDNNQLFELPPTVIELFDDSNSVVRQIIHLKEHEQILKQRGNIKTQIKRYDNDLEKYLSTLYNRNDDIDLFADLLVYFQDIFHLASSAIDDDSSSNHYMKLIYRISESRNKNDPWNCISFNYDTIFEKSLIATAWFKRRTFSSIQDYVQGPNPKILKMHGGINFRYIYQETGGSASRNQRDIFNFMMKERSVEGGGLSLSNIDGNPPVFYRQNGSQWNGEKQRHDPIHNYNFPVMMIPIHATKKSENPFFESMLDEASREIKESSLVVSIGYNFGDDLFCEKINGIDTSQKILILVGTNTLLEELEENVGYKNISKVWKGTIRIFAGNGFASFVDAI